MSLGFGTAAIGRPQYINIRQKKATPFSFETFRQAGFQMLENAYQLGIRYFDTAPGYGMAEDLLMDWAAQKQDETIEIATKWGYTYTANFDPNAKVHEVKSHALSKLNAQWERSQFLLPKLTTYQIHSATFETGVLENVDVLKRLAELKEAYGLHIGLTTSGANQVEVLKKAVDVSIDEKQLFDVFQVTYNIFDQSLTEVAESIAFEGGRLIIKEALANGRAFPNPAYPHYAKHYQKLEALARKYKVGVDAVALRFCLDSLPVYRVLSGASQRNQLEENLKVSTFSLEEAEIARWKNEAVKPTDYWSERKQLAWN